MPKFRIEQYEIHTMAYEVEAATEADGVCKVLNGMAIPVDDSQEYIEVADDYGLPADKHRELADELRSLGVSVGEVVIPSIRSIERIE